MARALFSEHWHSVAELKPRLVPTPIYRHLYRGKVWHVLQDRTGGRCHRFSAATYELIKRMNGVLTVQQIWEQACLSSENDIPTQSEIVDILIQLHAADVLQTNITPDSALLFERYIKRRNQHWKQWLLNPMSLKVPLCDPSRLLDKLTPYVACLLNWKGVVLWCIVVIPAMFLAAEHWSSLTDNLSDQILSSSNLWVMAAVFPFIKGLHELGHGLTTKAWGGEVREMGVMMLVFAPAPYVEASSSSLFISKYQRAIVGAAGMLVEIFVSALAMYVWVLAEPGLVRACAFNVMVIAGFSTLIVNGNPLMRYDGYFILSDLIEIPNLDQRGKRYLSYWVDHTLFAAKELEAPHESPSEKRWLVLYTLASWCYRTFVTFSIILFIAGKFFIFGVLLAAWSAVSLCILPFWKAWKHISLSPHLQRTRARVYKIAASGVLALILLTAFIPFPIYTLAEGVVWLPEQAMLYAENKGTVARWFVKAGDSVHSGTPIALMEEPSLEAELVNAKAKVAEALARYRAEQFIEPAKAALSLQQLAQEQRILALAEERVQKLVVRAQSNGILMVPHANDKVGQFFKQGERLGYVLNQKHFKVRVVVRQDNIDLVRTRLRKVELRMVDALSDVLEASIIREVPGGTYELPTSALSLSGGGQIPTDPKDKEGIHTLERVFIFDLALPKEKRMAPLTIWFGERVYVRFTHDSEPIVKQIYRRLRQLFLSHFNV